MPSFFSSKESYPGSGDAWCDNGATHVRAYIQPGNAKTDTPPRVTIYTCGEGTSFSLSLGMNPDDLRVLADAMDAENFKYQRELQVRDALREVAQ